MMQSKKIFFRIFLVLIILIISLLVGKIIMQFVYPQKYANYVEKYSNQYGIDKNLVYALIKQESNFNSKVQSSKGAKGLMQLMENTAKSIYDQEHNLYEPEINIKLGIKYLAYLIDKYDNYKVAIVAYNAGEGNTDKWINNNIISKTGNNLENIPFKETNMYLRKIMRNYEIYKKLY